MAFTKQSRTDYVRNNPVLQRIPDSQRFWTDYMQEINRVIHEGRSGTFTPTFTGFSTDPAGGKVYWKQSGALVTLIFEALGQGTSDTTSFTISNLPEDLQPDAAQVCAVVGLIDNGVESWGSAIVSGDSVTFVYQGVNNATSWTGSGSKGFVTAVGASMSITYNVVQ